MSPSMSFSFMQCNVDNIFGEVRPLPLAHSKNITVRDCAVHMGATAGTVDCGRGPRESHRDAGGSYRVWDGFKIRNSISNWRHFTGRVFAAASFDPFLFVKNTTLNIFGEGPRLGSSCHSPSTCPSPCPALAHHQQHRHLLHHHQQTLLSSSIAPRETVHGSSTARAHAADALACQSPPPPATPREGNPPVKTTRGVGSALCTTMHQSPSASGLLPGSNGHLY